MICDKGYVNYKKFDTYTKNDIYFVSQLKDNATINLVEELPVTYSEGKLLAKGSTILFDKKVKLGSAYINLTKKTYRIIVL